MNRVMVQFNFPGMTTKQYDECWNEIRNLGHDHPKGLIHHVSCMQGNNLAINDVWESEQAFNEFGKVLNPILQKLGAPPATPKISNVIYEQSNVMDEVHY